MEPSVKAALERDVRRLCRDGDFDGAATAAVAGYGSEIFSLLCALHRNEDDASDVFSTFSVNVWTGLKGFGWQSSLRTWAYTIARHASYRFLRGVRRARQGIPASDTSVAEQLAERVRTATPAYMRTETKDKLARIRETLPVEDQLLLMLRVDRQLEWLDLARVLSDDELDDAAATREAARLRKRFQVLKEKLVTLAKAAGIVEGPD